MCHKSRILHLCPWVAKDCGALRAHLSSLWEFTLGPYHKRSLGAWDVLGESETGIKQAELVGMSLTSSLWELQAFLWDNHQLNTECTQNVLGMRNIEWGSFERQMQREVHCKSPLLSSSQCTTLTSYRNQRLYCFVLFYVYFPRVSTFLNLNTSQPHSVVIFLQTELSAI